MYVTSSTYNKLTINFIKILLYKNNIIILFLNHWVLLSMSASLMACRALLVKNVLFSLVYETATVVLLQLRLQHI